MGSTPVPTAPQKARLVDLRSDALSKPTPEMRQVMANAAVGDEVYDEEVTINELEVYSAKLFGKEAGLFFPSGTMSNLAAVLAHCPERGQEVILGDESHIHMHELGGISAFGSLHPRTVRNRPDGTFSIDELRYKIRNPNDFFAPPTGLVAVEDTHNRCGGMTLPMEFIEKVAQVTKSQCLPLHMDGARVFNAAAYLNLPVSEICKDFDSVSICLSKGLCSPVGTVLVGDKKFIRSARNIRKTLGGAMRQAGILAAAGLYSIKNLPPKLKEDHRRAYQLGQAIELANCDFIKLDQMSQTNMVFVRVDESRIAMKDLLSRLEQVCDEEVDQDLTKLRASDVYGDKMRLVTYQGLTDEDIDAACRKLRYVIESLDKCLD